MADTMTTYDAIVVGAGPAGSVAALTMARRGLNVLLCDRAHFPRPKPCGEGLLPGGVQILEELDLLSDVIKAGGCPFDSIRFHFPGQEPADLPMNPRAHPFDRPTHGIAISRETFDNLLLDAAQTAGAQVRTGFRVVNLQQTADGVTVLGANAVAEKPMHATDGGTKIAERARADEFRARFVVIATGGAVPAGAGGVERNSAGPARIGFSTHIPDLHPTPRVDVFIRDGYEIYTSPVDGGRRVVAIACDRRRMDALGKVASAEAHRLLIEAAALPDWLRDAPADRVAGRNLGDNRYRSVELGENRILRVGDAAFRTDPVAAQGMMLAMLTGRAAGVRIHASCEGDCAAEKVVAVYRRDVFASMRRSGDVAASLLRLTRHPAIGRRLIAWAGSASRRGLVGRMRRQLVAHGIGFALPLPFEPLTRRVPRQEIMDRVDPDNIPGSTWRFLELANARFGGLRDRRSSSPTSERETGHSPRG
jgi:menaquinone-9 beta-reductase